MHPDSPKDASLLTDAERAELAKYASAVLAIPAVVGVAAPYIDAYVPEGWLWVSIPVVVALTVAGVRGIHAVAFPAVRVARPQSIPLAVVAALVLLLASPEAIRLSVVNYPVRPVWSFTSIGGAVLSGLYLLLAFRSRKSHSQPPNTSLERTRER